MFNFAVKKDFFFTTNKALDEKGFYCLEPTTCRCCIVCRISVRCWDNSVLACRPPGDPWRIGGGRNLRCITPCLSITLVSYCIDMLQCITHQDSIAFRLQWILLCIDSWKIRVRAIDESTGVAIIQDRDCRSLLHRQQLYRTKHRPGRCDELDNYTHGGGEDRQLYSTRIAGMFLQSV